jgi:cell wall-associated NlpC family hydrolase
MLTVRREQFRYMKNKYLTRFLCLTLMSGMVLSGPASVLAAEDTAAYTADGSDFSDSGDFDSGSEDPAPADPTPAEPTPAPVDPTPADPTPAPVDPTPTPAEPTPAPADPTPTPTDPTPTPANPTPTPSSQITKAAQDVIDRIKELNAQTITLEKKATVQSIRTAYNALSDTEKAQVSNYNLLVQAEATIAQLEAQKNNANTNNPFTSNTSAAQIGTPVYYASNIHAGKDFYLDSLKNNYNLTFSDDFASVMDEIEKEYKEKNKVADASDVNGSKTTTSADSLLVRNWQDILAVYVYQQSQDGKTEFTLDSSCKKDLAKIFAEMNPIVRDKQDITHVTYANRKINYYIKKNKIAKKDRTILKKYVETDCKLLCAVVTAANGFVRESVGDDVSEERVNVISAAYSLVGKVGYFWGGKSTVIGEDPGWGTSEKVSAEGSKSTGTIRAYGLDCSGFVTWAVINGYQDKAMQEAVGDGTSDQWEKANVVTEADAQPGDLVFQKGPEAGSDNHVGILCGKTDAGDWIAVHCSSGKNGVTVGEAYSASFRYIRQPSFYPTQEQVQEMQSSSTVSTTTGDAAASTGTDIFSANVTVSNTLQDAMKSNTSDSTGFTTSESTEKTSILPDKIDLSKEKVAVFKAK